MFEKIISFENLYRSYRNVRRLKRYYPAQQKYEFNLETNLCKLQQKLKNPSKYNPRPYRRFAVYEPKKRQISAPHFEDRIVHQAIVRVIGPGIVEKFIPQSYACIENRGTHKAVADIKKALGELRTGYYLKADISRYFASVNHEILKKLLRKYISCPKTLCLLDKIIDSYEDGSGRGIPIGNLTSQLFANLYLNELDWFVASRNNLGHFRYMDDFVVISRDKNKLIRVRDEIEAFLQSQLQLTLHPRKRLIQRLSFGIDFCGYQIFPNRVVLRKRTIRRFVRGYKKRQKKLENLRNQLASHLSPELNPGLEEEISDLEGKLDRSVTSHLGFLKYSEVDRTRGEYTYANNIRLPYLPT